GCEGVVLDGREKREQKQADDKFDDQNGNAAWAGCYHYHLLIASGKVLRRRLRGLTESRPTNTSSAKISSVGRPSAEPPSNRDRFSYKKRSMIGPSLLIVAAGHNFRSVMIALSRA